MTEFHRKTPGESIRRGFVFKKDVPHHRVPQILTCITLRRWVSSLPFLASNVRGQGQRGRPAIRRPETESRIYSLRVNIDDNTSVAGTLSL